MSNHLISEAYKRQIGNMARKAVMVLFADKASDDGSGIWASKQRMAEEIGASKQTVIATIKGLIDDGLIEERGHRRCANGFTVEYAIIVSALKALPLTKCHADQSENLTGQAALPVKQADPTGQAALPEPSLNPEPPVIANAITPPLADDTVSEGEVIEAWNDLASDLTLPQVVKLTKARKRHLACRRREHPFEDWAAALAAIRRSRFLQGDNPRGWRANLDWLLRPDTIPKLLEGQFDDTAKAR